ncbi:helix-turn-helix transcriptional regulator [Phreatobacter oligotrophus]|jgi:AraC family transcriptional regulator|uniref:AraC-like DNA-binding protein n=2 Tax=Phreatobacter oligotrophus TaxID=1122261 RepID=A0A2T4YZV3_9HYPH|nr:AraC family transcriptional regulator [Phreatobacter oligotrophus]PTM52772.1 AraC-like DNA-binding protein [Phreatobacter oligotrophus]
MILKPLNGKSGGRLDHTIAAAWPGFAVHSSRRKTDYSINYTSRPEHYIALHHFVRRDGETRIEGGPVSPLTDLRGKLTQIPAGYEATGWTVGPENDGRVTMMFFDPARLSEDLGRLYESSPIQPKLYFEDPDVSDALMRLDRLLQEGEDLADLYAESIGLFIAARLLDLTRRDQETERPGLTSKSRMALLDDYLRSNIGRQISIEDLANLAGLSRFHLIRSFRDAFGVTPYQYLLRLRMTEARRLLLSTNLPVAQIATRVGFSSSTQFVKMFRSMEGVTPGSLRQR